MPAAQTATKLELDPGGSMNDHPVTSSNGAPDFPGIVSSQDPGEIDVVHVGDREAAGYSESADRDHRHVR